MKNKTILISFIIILSICFYNCFSAYINDVKIKKLYDKVALECKSENNTYSEYVCSKVVGEERKVIDVYTLLYSSLNGGSELVYFFQIPIIVSAIWVVSKEIRSSFVKNYTMRKSYKDYFKHLIKKAYAGIWIYPTVMILLFILCVILSGNFNYPINNNGWQVNYLERFPSFYTGFILNKLFFSIFYANLALIFAKKNKSVIVAALEAIITFFIIGIFNETIIVGLIFKKILHIDLNSGIINILDCLAYFEVYNDYLYLLVSIVYALNSFIVVYFMYRNKEKMVINSEELRGGKEYYED